MGRTHTLEVVTNRRCELVDVTARVGQLVKASEVKDGVCTVFCPHTTAAVTINENADPDVVHDVLGALDLAVPWRQDFYRHDEGNSAAHAKSSMVGCSATVPIREGRLALGTWQAIYFCEFDGPRTRQVIVTVTG